MVKIAHHPAHQHQGQVREKTQHKHQRHREGDESGLVHGEVLSPFEKLRPLSGSPELVAAVVAIALAFCGCLIDSYVGARSDDGHIRLAGSRLSESVQLCVPGGRWGGCGDVGGSRRRQSSGADGCGDRWTTVSDLRQSADGDGSGSRGRNIFDLGHRDGGDLSSINCGRTAS